MLNQTAFVIGDMYESKLGFGNLFTKSELLNLLRNEQALEFTQLHIGQGIELGELQIFEREITSLNPHIHLSIPPWIYEKEQKEHVHKQQDHNVLISFPRCVDSCYINYVSMGHNDLVKDHTTGLHMQAMLLLEASRQTTIAIMERFIHPREKCIGFKSILNSMHSQYHKYTLPLEIMIKTREVELKSNNKSLYIVFESEMHQNNTISTKFLWNVSCHCAEKIRQIERRRISSSLLTMASSLSLCA